MKRLILDVSDCTESPLLAESRRGRALRRPANFEENLLLYSRFHRRRNDTVHQLTEEFYHGRPDAHLDFVPAPVEVDPPPVQETDETAHTYQTRCAQRWWGEVRKWFGPLE